MQINCISYYAKYVEATVYSAYYGLSNGRLEHALCPGHAFQMINVGIITFADGKTSA